MVARAFALASQIVGVFFPRADGSDAVLVGAMGLVWIIALGSASVIALGGGRHVETLRVRELMLARAVPAINERVPPNAVVGAPELWAGLALHTGRRVAPSARFRPAGEGPIWGNPREQFAV